MSGSHPEPPVVEKQQEKRQRSVLSYFGSIQFLGKRRRETSGTSVQSLLETPSPLSSERGFSEDGTERDNDGTVVSDFDGSVKNEDNHKHLLKPKELQEAQAANGATEERKYASTARESAPVNVAVRRDRKCLRLYLPAQTPDAEEERERTALDTVIAETCTRELRIEGLSAKVDPTQLKALARLGSGTFGYVELVICESGPHKGRTMAVKDEVWLCTEPMDFSLRALMNLGSIEGRFVAHVTLCMVRGLHHLSTLKRRIIHRDVHPGNVLLGFGGCVKLIDFGLSAELIHTTRCSGTKHTGKPEYLAPECRRSPPRSGIRSDVWAVGVTANEAATGIRPFDDQMTDFKNPAKPLAAYLSRQCSSKFNDVISVCLATDFHHRPLYPELMTMPLLVDAAQDFQSTTQDFTLWLKELRNTGLLG
ncbi:mitogen-activated protein kinase (MAPK proteinK protein) [Aphelenchoides avenae]|nr:mitogen-activated protein kinase (MAPK proteinK protein) [Aphelenchus avenae]